jgi:two-component system, sensor histidine kinase PdtaS
LVLGTIERWRSGRKWGLGFGVVAFLVSFGLRYGLDEWLRPGFPFVTFFPAVILTTFFAGLRPGALVAVLSGLAGWHFFLSPFNSFALDDTSVLALIFYAVVITLSIFPIHVLELALERLQRESERAETIARQRDTMFTELQHRVSNNLQLVASLLTLERANVTDEHAKQALANAFVRLTLIGKLHRKLHDPSGGLLDFGAFLEDICSDILETSGARNIQCLVTRERLILPPEKSIPVALIATELVSNAIEHGFAGQQQGTIRVDVRSDETSGIVLTITDDGSGLPANFDATQSLGLRTVQALTQGLGGRFEIVNEKGATFRVVIPFPSNTSTVVNTR